LLWEGVEGMLRVDNFDGVEGKKDGVVGFLVDVKLQMMLAVSEAPFGIKLAYVPNNLRLQMRSLDSSPLLFIVPILSVFTIGTLIRLIVIVITE
jgi:hypothetical protein